MLPFQIVRKQQPLTELSAIKELSREASRENARILVIDDNEVPQVPILQQRGYTIRVISDIEDFSAVEPYDIVLCDILGIGQKFQSPLEGAYVARKIKEKYPTKRVLLYTGGTYEDRFNEAMRNCDGYIQKDAQTDDWEDLILTQIDEARDPVRQWKALRSRLLESDVPLLLVYNLEQRYIEAVKKRNPALFPGDSITAKLEPALGAMVKSLAKSIVFKALPA